MIDLKAILEKGGPWQEARVIGECLCLLGDCAEILPVLPQVDAVITDPPYGISHESSHGATWQNTTILGDTDTKCRDTILSGFTNVACCGTWKTPPIAQAHSCIVWDKDFTGMGNLSFPWKPSFELIYFRGNLWSKRHREPGVLKIRKTTWENNPHGNFIRYHPHEKPIELFVNLIEATPVGSLLLDPFAGSFTTGVACVQLGRQFIGIEIDPHYYSIGVKRIEEANKQGKLFVPTPPVAPEQRGLF